MKGKNVYLMLHSSILTKTLEFSVKTENTHMSYKYVFLV